MKQASQTVSPTAATVTATATASSSIGTCSFEQDIDYIGNQIWTYIPATSACWLKRQVGSYRVTSVGRN